MKSRADASGASRSSTSRHRVVLVDPLRAAVRRGQEVRAGGRRWSAILGGWQVTNIMSLSSGFARNPNVGQDRANLGHGDQRPTVVSGQDPNDGPKTIQQWFNTSAFVLQPRTTYGDAVRNSITGPGIFNFDMSILRNFTFGGSKSLQFRLEAFNTFNQPVWQDPNTAVTSPRSTARSPARASRCASCSLA